MTHLPFIILLQDNGPPDYMQFLPFLILLIVSALGSLFKKKTGEPPQSPPERTPSSEPQPLERPKPKPASDELSWTARKDQVKPLPRPVRPMPKSQSPLQPVRQMKAAPTTPHTQPAPAMARSAPVAPAQSRSVRRNMALGPATLRQAIILSEIIGKPKGMQ